MNTGFKVLYGTEMWFTKHFLHSTNEFEYNEPTMNNCFSSFINHNTGGNGSDCQKYL